MVVGALKMERQGIAATKPVSSLQQLCSKYMYCTAVTPNCLASVNQAAKCFIDCVLRTLHGPLKNQCLNIGASILQQHRSKAHVSLKPPPHMSSSSGMSKGLSGLSSSTNTSRILSNGSQPAECCRRAKLCSVPMAEAWWKGAMSPL